MNEEANIFEFDPELTDADRKLIGLYAKTSVSVDFLAYTEDFDQLHQQYRDAGYAGAKAAVFRRLLILRKAGLLPRLFRSARSA